MPTSSNINRSRNARDLTTYNTAAITCRSFAGAAAEMISMKAAGPIPFTSLTRHMRHNRPDKVNDQLDVMPIKRRNEMVRRLDQPEVG